MLNEHERNEFWNFPKKKKKCSPVIKFYNFKQLQHIETIMRNWNKNIVKWQIMETLIVYDKMRSQNNRMSSEQWARFQFQQWPFKCKFTNCNAWPKKITTTTTLASHVQCNINDSLMEKRFPLAISFFLSNDREFSIFYLVLYSMLNYQWQKLNAVGHWAHWSFIEHWYGYYSLCSNNSNINYKNVAWAWHN